MSVYEKDIKVFDLHPDLNSLFKLFFIVFFFTKIYKLEPIIQNGSYTQIFEQTTQLHNTLCLSSVVNNYI